MARQLNRTRALYLFERIVCGRIWNCLKKNMSTFCRSLFVPMHISDFAWHQCYAVNLISPNILCAFHYCPGFFFFTSIAAHRMDTLYTMNHKSLAQATNAMQSRLLYFQSRTLEMRNYNKKSFLYNFYIYLMFILLSPFIIMAHCI